MYRIKKLPPRPAEGQKGLFGRVLVVGGNAEMIGAPALAATAALRLGSGLLQVAVPRAILQAVITIIPEAIGLGLDDSKPDVERLEKAVEQADVVVVGPGMGKSPVVGRRVMAVLKSDKPVVVDADALNYLSSLGKWPKSFTAPAVLTPHPGEMHRLTKKTVPTDDVGRIKLASDAAKATGKILVLKGHRTVVTDGNRIYVNHTGDSSLSKAGAGDVLSGMIASLIGQKMDIFDAACLGVHLHGLAGAIAGQILGRRCVLARDVIESISDAIRE
jgi:ADP-dependent NAD(P)H-hydrate dehydratase